MEVKIIRQSNIRGNLNPNFQIRPTIVTFNLNVFSETNKANSNAKRKTLDSMPAYDNMTEV
ncbi:hypothetical protein FACS1894211_03910 [Clostridia bacterium]|nr:hypothetical protein FACS1894211_03910 [Clostridia bacterium]